MLQLRTLTCDRRTEPFGLAHEDPVFGWMLESDLPNTLQIAYHLRILSENRMVWDSGKQMCEESVNIPYEGNALLPHADHAVHLTVWDNHGQTAELQSRFYTGKLHEPWQGTWIGSGNRNDRENRLPVEIFRKTVALSRSVTRAVLYVSALGIYEAMLNGVKVGEAWFTPGYTSYAHTVQFQAYDLTPCLQEGDNTLDVWLANGWYCGTIIKRNNFYGNRRALCAEIHLTYSNGESEVLASDETWHWTSDGPIRQADFYNGEMVETAREMESGWQWQPVRICRALKLPALVPQRGAFVHCCQEMTPMEQHQDGAGRAVFDMGQNFSGVVRLEVLTKPGDVITVRHAEILDNAGALYTENLRSAKARSIYHCDREEHRMLTPRFTFMGFRYVEVGGIDPERILSVTGLVLSSDNPQIGSFSCSDPLVNRLQENIRWGQLSNFVDIPTDCPQRNERVGWTGDIALFASTACFNADIRLFLDKWLTDVRAEQSRNGCIPFTVPDAHAFTPFRMATAGWGDAAILVPWAVWLAYGDKAALRRQYASMKAWLEAERRAASFLSFGYRRYIWSFGFQFGDWCAPGETVKQWMAKGKWLATAYIANSAHIMHRVACVLGEQGDAERYWRLHARIKDAFQQAFLKEDGTLTGDFQSAYVCALHFDLLPEEMREQAAERLAGLVEANNGCLATGFLGTPYLPFALGDAGKVREAYSLLLNTKAPGWLYTVKAGGTTIWERWDALDENGGMRTDIGISDMVSFNHYAYGAVGDWFYRRICGLESDWEQAGYKYFTVRPQPDPRFSYAEGCHQSPYGNIRVRWEREHTRSVAPYTLHVQVPPNTTARVVLPDGKTDTVGSGTHVWSFTLPPPPRQE